MKEITSARASELGDQVHKLQRRIRDLRKELEELEGQHAVYVRRFADAVGSDTCHFASSDGFVKVAEFDYESDPENDADLDLPAIRALIRAARRRIPVVKRMKVVVRWARANEVLD